MAFPASALPGVLLDARHAGAAAETQWADPFLDGWSRLATSLARHPVALRPLRDPWSAAALSGTAMLVLPGLNPVLPPSADEVTALDKWLQTGGVLLTAYPADDSSACRQMNALLGRYGVALTPERVVADRSNDTWMYNMDTAPMPARSWQQDAVGALTNCTRLWYHSGVFADFATPLLTAHGKPLAVQAQVGKGRIYAFGSTDFLNNRYTAHCDNQVRPEWHAISGTINRQGMSPILGQPDNNRYLDQFVDVLCHDWHSAWVVESAESNRLVLTGGGELWLPTNLAVRVDGQPASGAAISNLPAYRAVQLPAGRHEIVMGL